ncbi:MAG TPA: RHS repeat-associated core domain-containing protein [Acidobacteriota bacterium]|nr:RHS repeat-associated core domain-containing protein [Acidobacteriota bacterium]
MGEVIWEFPLNSPTQDLVRGWFNGRLVVENDTRPGGGLHNFFRDHLGSTQVTADFFTGALVCSSFYHPFGQSADPAACDGHVRKFTQKERDIESGLDYFGARYCDSLSARFLSPDPLLASADPNDPQTWNRYSYTFNRPMLNVDPDGRDPIRIDNPMAGIPSSEELNRRRRARREAGIREFQKAVRDGTLEVKMGMMPAPAGGAGSLIAGGGRIITATLGAGETLLKVGGAIAVGLGIISLSEETDEPAEDAEVEENTDLRQPGTLRNPDGTVKDPEDQLQGVTKARDRGQLIETMGKSEQNVENRLRSSAGRSAEEVIKEFEEN